MGRQTQGFTLMVNIWPEARDGLFNPTSQGIE
jgi:hypothetical protein